MQQNSSVNLSGKQGKGIELDGFVEAEIVQPLKKYASGHTTVPMCQRLMANVDMLKLIRAAYVGKQGFDAHHSSRHSEQTSFPDQLKGAWFCLQRTPNEKMLNATHWIKGLRKECSPAT